MKLIFNVIIDKEHKLITGGISMKDLKGTNVLVDGYNLELPDGTGLKTYGITLIQALKILGSNVGVLTSKKCFNNSFLNDVLLYNVSKGSFNKLGLLKDVIRAASGVLYKAQKMGPFDESVIKKRVTDNFPNYIGDSEELFNLPQCYLVANFLYNTFGYTTKITVPGKVDIWHATYPLPVKIKKTKKITTLADLIPLILPHTTLDDKKVYWKKIKDSIKTSAIIITISEHSKKDLIDMFDVMPDKIFVTYPPIQLQPLASGKEEISLFLKKYNLEFRNYIFFVGAIEPRKNVGRLIDAYSMIDTSMPLVIVGKKAWLYEDELARNLQNVRLLGHVPADDLRYLYSGAYCFVFPSLYEGFGLPPLEAMSFGCPVITSNVSSLPEVCGDAALYLDPYDINDISEKIKELLDDQKLRTEFAEAGKERAKIFNMENYVKQVYKAYNKVA